MVRKKIDSRIRTLIENGVALKHRSFFVLVGDRGRDQVVNLHYMLSKATVKARPSVLWCYKKELGFSSHRKKRMRQLKSKMARGLADPDTEDVFDLFISSTNIRYTYYQDTHKILGNTYGMLVLQDFEALTPNLLARTIETVEGGGVIVLLLRTMKSLRQLYTMTMDVHNRFRTEAHQHVVGRFNERLMLSLAECQNTLVLDDELNVLAISSHSLNVKPVEVKEHTATPEQLELEQLKKSLVDTQPVGLLIGQTCTLDQGKALLTFIEAIGSKSLAGTVTLTAARGRGKSAALGLAVAAAIGYGYSNIFITSPSPENLKTTFEFVFKGLDALEYEEHVDYSLVQSTNPAFNNAVVRVNVFREHRQTIQYLQPQDSHKLSQAELLVIDEAAAIPMPLVKALLGNYLVFMSSTVNGYEGTGRALSLKLIKQLRAQSAQTAGPAGRALREIQLEEPIRYAANDPIERWLNDLLCLDCQVSESDARGRCPHPSQCDLYYINRDTLFSYHRASEVFLHRLMALYVASHYKNSPNDLQLLSDAPAHHLFCLLGPVDPSSGTLPEVLCVAQVCLEGEISRDVVMASMARGKAAAGDLIPWTVSQQFQDNDFPSLSGARIVRIATHPAYQKMGYGSRVVELLKTYYSGRIVALDENKDGDVTTNGEPKIDPETDIHNERLAARKDLPPLLYSLSERPAERLHWLGVAYGVTQELLKFWAKNEMRPVYLRQTANDLTGEHTCIMLQELDTTEAHGTAVAPGWLDAYVEDFHRRFVSLLSFQFRAFNPALSLSLLDEKGKKLGDPPVVDGKSLNANDIESLLTPHDRKRLVSYSRKVIDYHGVIDLVPTLARNYFTGRIPVALSSVMMAVLLGIGLQCKSLDDLVIDCGLPANQLLAMFNRAVWKICRYIQDMEEKQVGEEMAPIRDVEMEPSKNSLAHELNEAAHEFAAEMKQAQNSALDSLDLSRYKMETAEDAMAEDEDIVPTASEPLTKTGSAARKQKQPHAMEKKRSVKRSAKGKASNKAKPV